MINTLKNTVLVGAITIALTACNHNRQPEDSGDVTSQTDNTNTSPITTTDVAVYAMGVEDTIELKKLDGTVVATTTISDEGKITFDSIESVPSDTPLIATITAKDGSTQQALYAASEIAEGINITPMTTLVTQMLDKNSDILTKRDELLTEMKALGMTDDDWTSTDSEVFINDSIYGQLSSETAEDFIATVKEEISNQNISISTMRSGFPNAHGGIAELEVIDNGVLSLMSGESGSIPAAVYTVGDVPLETDKYTLSLKNAPSWVQVSDTGTITFTTPETAQRTNRENFTIVATPKSGATIREVMVSYAIDPVKVLLEGTIGPAGGKVENEWKDIYMTAEAGALSNSYTFKLMGSVNENGNLSFSSQVTPELTEADAEKLDLTMPSSDLVYDNYFNENSNVPTINRANNNYSDLSEASKERQVNGCVNEFRGKHKTDYGLDFSHINYARTAYFKIPPFLTGVNPSTNWERTKDKPVIYSLFGLKGSTIKEKCASLLLKTEANTQKDQEPVLFVHGFDISGELPSASYWGAFPKLISEHENGKYRPYMFQWRTNARFNDVSRELAEAVQKINEETGKQVHIVAHSFGGLLTRTMIQGISSASRNESSKAHPIYTPEFFEKRIASVTTVGTPHSGISDTVFESQLPDGLAIGLKGFGTKIGCEAISCWQAGDRSIFKDTSFINYVGSHGNVIGALNNTVNNYPKIPTQALVGINKRMKPRCQKDEKSNCNLVIEKAKNKDLGDDLISYHGQRFKPNLLNSNLLNEKYIKERILNLYGKDINIQNSIMTANAKSINLPDIIKPIKSLRLYNGFLVPYDLIDIENNDFKIYKHTTGWGENDPTVWNYKNGGGSYAVYTHGVLSEATLENCYAKGKADQNCNHASWRYVKDFLAEHVAGDIAPQITANIKGNIIGENDPTYVAANNNAGSTIDYTQAEVTVLSTILIGDMPLANGTVNTDGTFSIPAMFEAQNLSYDIKVTMPGYRSVKVRGSDAQISVGATPEESNLDFGTIVLQPNELVIGDLGISAIDAFTGQTISNFNITATNSVGNTFSSDSGMINGLPRGTYNVTFTKDGYVETSQQCVVNALSTNACSISVIPLIQSSDDLVAVLTWGENPGDLDTHMVKYKADGSQDYHIYYSNRNVSGIDDNLDLDDTSSFGPETLSIASLDENATYIYAVRHYSGSGSLTSTSGAKVAIGQQGKSARILNVPTSGDGEWWKVFEVRNNVLYPCQSNCMFDDIPTLNNANSNMSYSASRPQWLIDMSKNMRPKS